MAVYAAVIMVVTLSVMGVVVNAGYEVYQKVEVKNSANAEALGAMEGVILGQSITTTAQMATTIAEKDGVSTNPTVSWNNLSNTTWASSWKTASCSSTMCVNYWPGSGTCCTYTSANVVTVTVTINKSFPSLFGVWGSSPTLTVSGASGATAYTRQFCALCVLGTGAGALDIENNATVRVTSGSAAVNSRSSGGLTIKNGGSLTADAITLDATPSLSGNAILSPSSYGTGTVVDPFASLATPTPTAGQVVQVDQTCDRSMGCTTLTLAPGSYHNISISNGANLVFSPAGTYFITGSIQFQNSQTANTFTSLGSLLYFTCGKFGGTAGVCGSGTTWGSLSFGNNTTASMSGPTSGTWKGMTIFYDRNNTATLSINNNSGGSFSGSIYAASAPVTIQNNGVVMATMGVVSTLDLKQGGSSAATFAYDPTVNGNFTSSLQNAYLVQ